MISYIIRRLLLLLPTAFLALSFLFLLFFVLPGDTATLLAGGANRNVNPEVVERVAERYHLNDSLFSQFWHYWGAHVPLGPRHLVRQQPQRQRHPAREGAAQPAPRLLGLDDRHHRRHLGRADLVGQALLAHRQGRRRSSPLPRRRSRCSCSGSCCSTRSRCTRTSTTGREWARLRTSRIGPDSWFAFVIPTGDQWRYLILPAIALASVTRGDHGAHDPRLDARRAEHGLHAHRPLEGPVGGSHHPPPRVAQRADPGDHAHRDQLRHGDRRRRAHRDRVLVAGVRVADLRLRELVATCR